MRSAWRLSPLRTTVPHYSSTQYKKTKDRDDYRNARNTPGQWTRSTDSFHPLLPVATFEVVLWGKCDHDDSAQVEARTGEKKGNKNRDDHGC
jgi:hypothetical protein